MLTPRRLRSIWREELEKIGPRDWSELRELSKTRDFFYKHLWWHASYREEGGPLFRVSDGRFALENRPVSYWAGDYELARNEITEELRDDPKLTFHKMLDHISEGLLRESPRRVKPGTSLLDLTTMHSDFLLRLEKLDICEPERFFKEVLEEKSKKVYPITQAIAEVAFAHGLWGVVWSSVRAPIDVLLCSGTCLVLFDEVNLLDPYT